MRAIRMVVTVVAALATLATPVTAGSAQVVAGSYRYSPFFETPSRAVSLRAHATEDGVVGTWQWTNLITGTTQSGPITCLVIDGADAWLAGPDSAPGDPAGAFFRVHDGGAPGVQRDEAVAWIGDPGQTLAELEGWCADRNADVPLFDLDSGNLVVHAGP